MRSIARTVYVVVAWLFVAGLVVQVFLAGLGVFEGPANFATHRDVGYALELFPVVLLIVGLLGGMGRRLAILAIVVFGQFILQSVFVAMRDFRAAGCGAAPGERLLDPLAGRVHRREATLVRTAPAESAAAT